MKKGPPLIPGMNEKATGGAGVRSHYQRLKAGAVCTIKWMFGNPQVMEFMHQHDIREGSTINVLQHGRDSMIIGMNNMRLAIGNEVAERIKV